MILVEILAAHLYEKLHFFLGVFDIENNNL